MKMKLCCFFVIVSFFIPALVFAANYCVRPTSQGANDGSDWNNAYGLGDLVDADADMPGGVPKRGNTFYITGEVYGTVIFEAPENSTSYIVIKKATASDHITEVGWSATWGTTVAKFTGWTLSTGYWDLDGQEGGGHGNWDSGFGIKVSSSTGKRVILNADVDNIYFRHLEIRNTDYTTGNPAKAGALLYAYSNVTNITIQYCKIHYTFGAIIQTGFSGADNWIIEHTKIGDNTGDAATHSELWSAMGNDGWIWRYNYLFSWRSTGCLIFINGEEGAFGDDNIAEDLRVHNNIFDQGGTQASGIIKAIDDNSNQQFARRWRVYNNTFIGLDSSSTWVSFVVFTYGESDNIIKNNVFWTIDSIDLGTGGGWTSNYNSFRPGLNPLFLDGSNDSPVEAPFKDTASKDFSLKEPLMGITLEEEYSKDIESNLRREDSWHRGAYNYYILKTPTAFKKLSN